jgi:hypothetical protein
MSPAMAEADSASKNAQARRGIMLTHARDADIW